MKTVRFPRALLATCAALLAWNLAAAAAPDAPFAQVGDAVITHQEFDAAFAQAARSKFYHGKPPEAEVAKLQREVGQNLVDQLLLAREARRRRIAPDAAAVQKVIAGYEERYRDSAQWKANRARLLPGLLAKLEQESVLEQLSRQVKTAADPTPAQLEQYYRSHKDKFTSPEQVHVRMILLKVDPSSPPAKWDAARQEGAAIVARLKKGADFGELARVHSGDPSAEAGGDLGTIHQGMLPEPAQQAVDKLKPGETTEPVQVLEGIAVLRLLERKPPVLNPLAAVHDRARDLYARQQADDAWDTLLVRLRREQPVKFDESKMLPLARADASATAR